MVGTRIKSTEPDILLSMPLCPAASGLIATSRAMGPSTIPAGSSPARLICASISASTVTGILLLTTSLAATTAT